MITITQGIATEVAKQVTGFIRESKFKVTTQIQEQQSASPARAGTSEANFRPVFAGG